MERKEYKLYATAKKTAKENNLVSSKREPNVYYDFSLLDQIKFYEDYEREMLENDIIKYTEITWFEQPLPTIILYDNFTHYTGQVRTAWRRVFNRQGKRIMIIVEVTKLHIEKQTRTSIYEQTMKTQYEYDAEVYRYGNQGDEEVA